MATAARMAALFSLIDHLAIHSFDRRLATLLLARPPIVYATHQTLADELGTVREVVSRILHPFATAVIAAGRSQTHGRRSVTLLTDASDEVS